MLRHLVKLSQIDNWRKSHSESECAAVHAIRKDFYVTTHLLTETFADAQAQTVALWIQASIARNLVKRLENLLLVFLFDSRPLVLNLEH